MAQSEPTKVQCEMWRQERAGGWSCVCPGWLVKQETRIQSIVSCQEQQCDLQSGCCCPLSQTAEHSFIDGGVTTTEKCLMLPREYLQWKVTRLFLRMGDPENNSLAGLPVSDLFLLSHLSIPSYRWEQHSQTRACVSSHKQSSTWLSRPLFCISPSRGTGLRRSP